MDITKKCITLAKLLDNEIYNKRILLKNPVLGFLKKPLTKLPKKFGNAFISVKSRPIMLICETINICNNNCVICAYSKMTRPKMTMPMEMFKKVLKDYSDMGGGKLSLTPVVGEIFLDKFLMDRIKEIKKHPLITGTSFTTNAVPSANLNDENIKFILMNIERMNISIYGIDPEEAYLITKRDNYSCTVKAINRIVRIARELDMKEKILFGFRFFKRHSDNEIKEWIYDKFNIDIPYGYTNTFANWGKSVDTGSELPYDGKWIKSTSNEKQCLIPLIACQVFSNGDISFCCCNDFDINKELLIGNIKEISILNAYNSKKSEGLWSFEKKIPLFCQECSFHRHIDELNNHQYIFDDPISYIGG